MERSLAFRSLHTGESLRTAYWSDGRPDPQGVAAIDRLLRDHRTGDVHPIDRRLLDLLWTLADALDTREPYLVISGYRSPRTNAQLAAMSGGVARRSLHLDGAAIDLRLERTPLERIRSAALALQGGGVGYYPGSGFVHIDIGRVRRW